MHTNYALIKNGKVENVVVIDDDKVLDVLAIFTAEGFSSVNIENEDPKPGPGWSYVNSTFEPFVEEEEQKRKLSKFAFRERFTFNELLVLDNFVEDPNIPQNEKQILNTIMNNFRIADEINLDHPLTVQGLDFLVQFGFLTQERVAEILA